MCNAAYTYNTLSRPISNYCSKQCVSESKKIPDNKIFETFKIKFEKYVVKSEGCWDWKSSKIKSGYGFMVAGKQKLLAHRFNWMMHNGPIPDGLFVLHSCDNPPCTKISHLFIGNHKDNALDCKRKGRGRGYFLQGIRSRATITIEIVQKIKNDLIEKIPCQVISKKYHVSKSIISKIKRGVTWKNI